MQVNFLDKALTEEQKKMACQVLDVLQLDNLKVMIKDQEMYFIQDRRVVHIPLSLIADENWADIRFLFRSILESDPPVWNHEASYIPHESYRK